VLASVCEAKRNGLNDDSRKRIRHHVANSTVLVRMFIPSFRPRSHYVLDLSVHLWVHRCNVRALVAVFSDPLAVDLSYTVSDP